MQLCLQESSKRYIKELTLCCDDIKEPRQYGCENYLIRDQKRKEIQRKMKRKFQKERRQKEYFLKRKVQDQRK